MISRELHFRILLIILIVQNIYIYKKYVIPTMKNNGTYEKYKWYSRTGLIVMALIISYAIYFLFFAR